MSYAEMRELVRLRYELRRLLAERPPGADADARKLIARIEELVAADTEEEAVVVPELARWAVSLAVVLAIWCRASQGDGLLHTVSDGEVGVVALGGCRHPRHAAGSAMVTDRGLTWQSPLVTTTPLSSPVRCTAGICRKCQLFRWHRG